MGQNLNLEEILSKIRLDLGIYRDQIRQRDLYKRSGNLGLQNKCSRLASLSKDRVQHYMRKLDKFGNGNIIKITFESDGTKYQVSFTNIQKHEATLLLEFKAELMGIAKPIILEIEDIPTTIQEVGL